MYQRSMDIVLERIFKRLNKRKNELKISSKDIIPDNSNLSSAILHNRKDTKKNPYLIPDTHISAIMKSLDFNSSKELLFGTDEEIELYSYTLFHALISDTLEMDEYNKSKAEKKYGKTFIHKLESVLADYVPYALISIYAENQEISDILFPTKILKIIDKGLIIRDEAIKRLYANEEIKYGFLKIFADIIIAKDTVVRLDKSFLDFTVIHLLPLLINVTSDNDKYSLGNRAYYMLTELINEWEHLNSSSYYQDSAHISESEAYHRDVIEGLLETSFEYAYNLYKLQKKLS